MLYEVPPKIVPFTFGDEPSNYGESASVQCSVIVGDFPLDIAWLLNGETITMDSVSKAKLSKRLSYLNIDSVSGEHAGNYSCVASNLAGAVEQMARLIVNGIYIYVPLYNVGLFLFICS